MLLNRGNFQPIDETFLTKSLDVFQRVSNIQEEYDRGDTDTFMNEVIVWLLSTCILHT